MVARVRFMICDDNYVLRYFGALKEMFNVPLKDQYVRLETETRRVVEVYWTPDKNWDVEVALGPKTND